jgi:hypothetical protein
MKDYSIGILQPGQAEEVNVFGNYIRNIGTGSIQVVARNAKKTVKAFSTVLGAGGWRSPESEYDHWTIKNNSSVALPVSVLIGKGEAGENSVQINADVNALTRFDNLTVDGNRYHNGGVYVAIASSYSIIGLVNADANNKKALITDLSVSGYGANVEIYKATTAEMSVISPFSGSPYGNAKNKVFGGADGVARIQKGVNTGKVGTLQASIPTDSAGNPFTIKYGNSPIEVSPGYGLLLIPSLQNNAISAYMNFWEEAA